MAPATTLICTLGTSLFRPNLAQLQPDDPDPARAGLARAYAANDVHAMARALASVAPSDRICGAEINANALLLGGNHVIGQPNLFLCHSDTDDGRLIARTLAHYYQRMGLSHVETRQIDDLQDSDPQRFRLHGLRNLARVLCKILRDHDASTCAINATGGYKAQIALAVLLGQAVGVPVYYKHERFEDTIIDIPPMPVSLNFEIWLQLSGLLYALDRDSQLPIDELELPPGTPDLFESLVDREPIDGVEYVALSPTGQIFHETFRHRFEQASSHLLPPAADPGRKRPPSIEDGHTRDVRGLSAFLEKLTGEIPQAVYCRTWYSHPNLPRPNKFWINEKGLVGQFGDGKGLAKFAVETTAQTREQTDAVCVLLNEWLSSRI